MANTYLSGQREEKIREFHAALKKDALLKEYKARKDYEGINKRIGELKKEYDIKPVIYEEKEGEPMILVEGEVLIQGQS